MKRVLLLALFCLLTITSISFAADTKPVKVGAKDKCPVCGMFVAKYPDFIAQIQFHDGTVYHFDGAKDMFKFYLDPARYAQGRKAINVSAVFVTSYYDMTLVDGMSAYYVVGSDVYGPMGRELIPFEKAAEARDFMKDHKGKTVLRFRDVSQSTLKPLN